MITYLVHLSSLLSDDDSCMVRAFILPVFPFLIFICSSPSVVHPKKMHTKEMKIMEHIIMTIHLIFLTVFVNFQFFFDLGPLHRFSYVTFCKFLS